MGHVSATFSQAAFRFREDDGSETAATWLADQNVNPTNFDVTENHPLRLRIGVQETAGGSNNNYDLTLEYRINGGAWLSVNGSTTAVIYRTSSFVANQSNTTSQLTMSGAFQGGAFVSDSGSAARISFSGNDHGENEYSLDLLAADLNDGDVIDFRLLGDGQVLSSYPATPTISVVQTLPDPPATAPTLTSPSKTTTSIDLSWTAVTGADTYELQRDETTIQNALATTRNDTGLTADTAYAYRVRGVNAGGPGPWSNVLNVTTDPPPSITTLSTDFSEGKPAWLTASTEVIFEDSLAKLPMNWDYHSVRVDAAEFDEFIVEISADNDLLTGGPERGFLVEAVPLDEAGNRLHTHADRLAIQFGFDGDDLAIWWGPFSNPSEPEVLVPYDPVEMRWFRTTPLTVESSPDGSNWTLLASRTSQTLTIFQIEVYGYDDNSGTPTGNILLHGINHDISEEPPPSDRLDHIDTELSPETLYTYRVRAVDDAGTPGEWSTATQGATLEGEAAGFEMGWGVIRI